MTRSLSFRAHAESDSPGRLIVLEGPAGVGKGTIARLVARAISRAGRVCDVLLTTPQKGLVDPLRRRFHRDQAGQPVPRMSPASVQAFQTAIHIEAIERRALPALASGHDVILDHFWWSTWVHGVISGVHVDTLRALVHAERAAWGDLRPQVVVLLLPSRSTIGRAKRTSPPGRLARGFRDLASTEKTQQPVIEILVGRVHSVICQRILKDLAKSTGQTGAGRTVPWRLKEGGPAPAAAPLVYAPRLAPAKVTAVYDTYWSFAVERQEVFLRRLGRTPPPWTRDPILSTYKFTNAYRAADRVSQYLIRRVIYDEKRPSSEQEVCFRILLFKLFNKIETWELLERELGSITFDEFRIASYDRVLTSARNRGVRIYSGAYIMPPGSQAYGHSVKHRNHLALLAAMMADDLPARLADARSMQRAFDLLRAYPTIGDFLAYQLVTDVNYSEVTRFSEMEFVVPGPGAVSGLRKCFADSGGLNDPEIIRLVTERQTEEFERLGLKFQSLWGRPLQLIDAQNLFCEVDKYARLRHPEVRVGSGRTRIKQRFRPSSGALDYWFPPKWGLNHLVQKHPNI